MWYHMVPDLVATRYLWLPVGFYGTMVPYGCISVLMVFWRKKHIPDEQTKKIMYILIELNERILKNFSLFALQEAQTFTN